MICGGSGMDLRTGCRPSIMSACKQRSAGRIFEKIARFALRSAPRSPPSAACAGIQKTASSMRSASTLKSARRRSGAALLSPAVFSRFSGIHQQFSHRVNLPVSRNHPPARVRSGAASARITCGFQPAPRLKGCRQGHGLTAANSSDRRRAAGCRYGRRAARPCAENQPRSPDPLLAI